MAECWEGQKRYLVTAENIAQSYCISTDGGLSLRVQNDFAYPGPVVAFIMPAEQAAPEWDGERWAVQFTVVGSDAEALKWFEEVLVTQPWAERH